jgi:hypothetical protein
MHAIIRGQWHGGFYSDRLQKPSSGYSNNIPSAWRKSTRKIAWRLPKNRRGKIAMDRRRDKTRGSKGGNDNLLGEGKTRRKRLHQDAV